MKKIFIYMMMVMSMGLGASCSGYENDLVTVPIDPIPEPTPQDTTKVDTTKWASWDDRTLPVGEDMIAHPAIYWLCTNGKRDSSFMEPWPLDIETVDLVVYRNEYQPSVCSGITPDAERTTSEEFKDKYNNLVKNHSYNQRYEFKNFTHSIYAAWRTGRIFYANGREASYLPEDGIYFNMDYHVNDTVHFVRNDTIYAREDIDINYIITLKKTAKRQDWQSWTRKAKVTVISFVGLVEKEPEIPTANHYGEGIIWHAAKGNRFHDGQNWHDAFLFASETNYYILVHFYTVDEKGKESNTGRVKFYTIPKSEMKTPSADRQYDGVIWDPAKGKPLPCRIAVDGTGWTLTTQYADGTIVNKRENQIDADISGIKNQPENHNAKATPWIEVNWGATQYKGKNHYNMSWKTTAHKDADTVADASLK